MAIDRAMMLQVRIVYNFCDFLKISRGGGVRCKTYQILINVILEQDLLENEKRSFSD